MYLLDANVFIQARRQYYAFDLVPAFWTWLEERHRAGRVFTIQKVADEITGAKDNLSQWMNAQPRSFRIDVEAADQPALQALSQWAHSGRFKQPAINDFLSKADYFLVAQAKTRGFKVVTHELPDPNAVKRIMIPEACKAQGVDWINTFELMRQEGARFAS
jgi:hypothetical protein